MRVKNLDAAEYAGELQHILNVLAKVQPGTTSHEDAQTLRRAAEQRLQEAAARAN